MRNEARTANFFNGELKEMPQSSDHGRLSIGQEFCESWRVKFLRAETRNPPWISSDDYNWQADWRGHIDGGTDTRPLPFTLLGQFYLRVKKSERPVNRIWSSIRIVNFGQFNLWLSPRWMFRRERWLFSTSTVWNSKVFDLIDFGWRHLKDN